MLNIRCIHTGPLAVNTYIVWREGDKAPFDCVVIDPANSAKVMGFLNENGLVLKAILLTHGHFDHIMGVARLKEQTGAKIYINKLDAPALGDNSASLAAMIGVKVDPSEVDVFVEDGSVIEEAGVRFRAVHTPGHTMGGVCYILDDERVIFSGDTLFRLSMGRTDLPGGDTGMLLDSIIYKLFTLKGDYRVLPGHEGETTLEYERKYNPCARGGMYE